jgi:tetratricopeptide (TPR) repeat protein
MTKMVIFLISLTVFLPWTSCGGENRAEEEYEGIKNGELRGETLIEALEDFEFRYQDHFNSKVDLGIYYLARGEEDRARDYLRRAETIAERTPNLQGKSWSGEGNAISAMYGALGQIYLNRQDYRQALDYTEKAIGSAGEDAGIYRALKGHVLVAQREYAGALETFDGLFTTEGTGEGLGAEDILAYLFLLAQAERTADAARVLNRYFETGAFFPGLGTFAAMVYRAAGETERAAYAIYLEQEYRSGYGEGNGGGTGENRDTAGTLPADSNFFAGEYLAIKDQIHGGRLSEVQFRRYIELESYFRLFPSYYWNLWLGARLVYPETYANFAPALQKIITLDQEGPFAREAWKELSALFGF